MSGIFEEIVVRCDGMLAPATYQQIYETAKVGGTIVEVGTALGAGTVALALGLQAAGRAGKVYSFDPLTGGPRRSIVEDERIAHIQANFAHFGVERLIEFVPQSLPLGMAAIPDGPVSVVMLDADGRIDRDLIAIADRLDAGASMIIDDYLDKVRVSRGRSWGTAYAIDSKMRLTYLLVEMLKRDGFISPGRVIGNTYFGEKLAELGAQIDPVECLKAYRELVFTKSHLPAFSGAMRSTMGQLERFSPSLLQKLRVLKRRNVASTPKPASAR